MEIKQSQGFYDFAGFRLDPKKKRLSFAEQLVSLTPKEYEVLLLLVENAGRTVEKNELLEKIWTGTFVEEGTLTRNISWLRKKLAARLSEDFKVIETVPKIGYRFLPEVSFIETSDQTATTKNPAANSTVSVAQTEPISPPPKSSAAPKKYAIFWLIPLLLLVMTGGFALYRKFSQHDKQVILATKIAPFSGLPGKETSPAFSPDGRQLVYSWDGGVENGNSDIYIKLIGAGEPIRLTQNSAEEINPVFSPDAKSIAFVRVFPTHNEIILIPALGGAERKIYDRAGYASISFSPDGKSLAFANLDLSENDAGIFSLDLQSGEKKKITTPVSPVVDHTPRFSPDGKSLAFIRYFSSFKREIFVVSAGGGEPHQITFDDARIYGLAWGADSEKLFFTSFRTANQLNLWQIPLGQKDEPELISTGSKNLESVAISPDGRTIAFVEENADENIWEIGADQSEKQIIRSVRADHSQQFSPDASQIAFASDRTGNYEIWLSNADGKNQRQLTNSQTSAGSPRFSPDGNFVAYDAQSAGKSDVYIISVNGGEPRRLTDGDKNNFLPAWSADGQTIFFVSNRSGSDQIWQIPVGGGEPVQITKHGGFEMFAAPDGKHLIYSKGNGKPGLWEIEIDGANEKLIPELMEAGGSRSWTVTNSGIYFTAPNTQPPYHIKFFNFLTRQTKIAANAEKPPLTYYSNLSVAPDGKKMLYARRDQNDDTIFLAEF